MEPIDLISIVGLIVSFPLALVGYFLLKQRKRKRKMLPRISGFGAGIYMFVFSMSASLLTRPTSEFAKYTITSILWSLAFGIMGYIGGHRIARNMLD
jgi:hypothetical protein